MEAQRQGKIQEVKAPADEAEAVSFDYGSLLPELDNILDETVDAALEEQRKSLALAFEDRTSGLLKSRSVLAVGCARGASCGSWKRARVRHAEYAG